MPHDVISTCPVCSSDLSVTRLHCASCGTTLEGDFSVGRFGRLGRDQMALLESFLRSRGNLREMERELGISYPTVRARVDGLVRALGLADDRAGEALPDDDDIDQPPNPRRPRVRPPVDPRAPGASRDRRGGRGHRDPRTPEDQPMTTTQIQDAIEHEIGTAGSLKIHGFEGSIELRATDGGSVRVQGNGERPLEEDFSIKRAPGALELSALDDVALGSSRFGRTCQAIVVDVPRVARVRVVTASGRITATGLGGDQRYRTIAAEIGSMPPPAGSTPRTSRATPGSARPASCPSAPNRCRVTSRSWPARSSRSGPGRRAAPSGSRAQFVGSRPVCRRDGLRGRDDLAGRAGPGRGDHRLGRRSQRTAASLRRPTGSPLDRARRGRSADRVPLAVRWARGRRRPANQTLPRRPPGTHRRPTWPLRIARAIRPTTSAWGSSGTSNRGRSISTRRIDG